MNFVVKVVLSSIVISFASWLAGRKPVLAGFIIALPLISMLAVLFTYFEYKDMNKVNQFADSILVAVPLSLAFFIPFFLNKWLKFNFALTYGLGLILLVIAYFLHRLIFKSLI